jgi:hypothetical protein
VSRLIVAFALLLALPASADSLQALMADDRLRLKTWLSPESGAVVGQEVRLTIELSTPRWFAGGTRITLPEVDGVVVLRRNDFATNLSRRENATTWVLQQWQLELYPQRAGRFEVPPITLELAVNDAEAGVVRGTLATAPLRFEASIPAALAGVESWLASSRFDATQQFDRELTALKPGDAFTRTIELRATELTAMMLPEPAFPELPGLSAYPALPELENRSNRGEATAIRRQSVSYLVEREGQYHLPEQTWYWWNTRDQRVEITTLPAVDIDAGAVGFAPAAKPQRSAADLLPALGLTLGLILALVLVVGLGLPLLRRRHDADPQALLRRAELALRRGSPRKAAALLYDWLNTRPPGADWLSLRRTAASLSRGGLPESVEALLRAAYADAASADAASAEAPSTSDKAALRALRKTARRRDGRRSGPSELALNPLQPRK